MNNVKIFGLASLALVALPLFGHHGTAVSYDQKKVVQVTGKVKEFLWRNPHSELFVDGTDAAGNPVTYSLELGSPNTMAKIGLTRKSFQPGDDVVLEMHPSFTNPTSGEAVTRKVVVNGKPAVSESQDDK